MSAPREQKCPDRCPRCAAADPDNECPACPDKVPCQCGAPAIQVPDQVTVNRDEADMIIQWYEQVRAFRSDHGQGPIPSHEALALRLRAVLGSGNQEEQ